MAFTARRPTQQLNIHCSNCGAITVHFESFIADGQIFEMVGTKLSEILAFMSTTPDVVLCEPCTALAAQESKNRWNAERDRIMREMELPDLNGTPRNDHEQPARYVRGDVGGESRGKRIMEMLRRPTIGRRAVSDQQGVRRGTNGYV
jgi:hypothetical protein